MIILAGTHITWTDQYFAYLVACESFMSDANIAKQEHTTVHGDLFARKSHYDSQTNTIA